MSTRSEVKAVIGEVLGLAICDIEDSTLLDDVGADSLDQVEMVMALEEKFGVEIEDHVAVKWTSVNDAVCHIESLTK